MRWVSGTCWLSEFVKAFADMGEATFELDLARLSLLDSSYWRWLIKAEFGEPMELSALLTSDLASLLVHDLFEVTSLIDAYLLRGYAGGWFWAISFCEGRPDFVKLCSEVTGDIFLLDSRFNSKDELFFMFLLWEFGSCIILRIASSWVFCIRT